MIVLHVEKERREGHKLSMFHSVPYCPIGIHFMICFYNKIQIPICDNTINVRVT